MAITQCRRLLAEGCKVDVIRLTGAPQMLPQLSAEVRTMLLHQAAHPRAGVNAEHDAQNGPLGRPGMLMRRILRHVGPLLTGTGLGAFWSLWAVNRRLVHPLSFTQMAYLSIWSRQVARYIEKEKPDAVYSAWGTANIAALLGRRAAKRKPRLVVSQRNNIHTRSEKSIFALTAHFIAGADALHVPSRGLADQVVEEYGISREKVTLVCNPAFNNRVSKLKQQKCSHPWIARKGEEKVLLWAGSVDPQKDLTTLLHAFRILCERRDARLILLGTPPAERWITGGLKKLHDGLEDRILTPGYAKNPYSWMVGADVFVLSSQWEGFGNVLVEAMACGCPVVSTDCEHGPREILGDGRWGRLTPVGDAEALADAIDATLDNPPPAEALIARARDFSEERIMPQFMEMLGLPHKPRSAETDSSPASS